GYVLFAHRRQYMPKHFEYLVYFFEVEIFLTLLYFSDYRERYSCPLRESLLGQVCLLPFFFYKICQFPHDYMFLQRNYTNLKNYMQKHIRQDKKPRLYVNTYKHHDAVRDARSCVSTVTTFTLSQPSPPLP